ncbi:uncharacterized protein BDR25DRAFT_11247 [Lindgomyces ingoldianus]|uniref:Uncharacterized protein n=1 Tax=Lindgomyces ingoldianus TaxID=673940 RepID=A0ACB6R2T2_9PLEO|nr:uncharacterized protein BDR25DRAFT_11247 [Lindgomyces ingoldianus]KAF2472746.1 hypothetical protein BDR25DRAFT_11247 [Lindgomyces ingoldianus]
MASQSPTATASSSQSALTLLSSSILYFALIFTSGLALGCIRVPFLQPILGDRKAQLLEMPVMLVAIAKSAQLIVRRLHPQTSTSHLAAIGFVALVLMLVAEIAGTVFFMGKEWKGWWNWVQDRDAVAGPVYFTLLAVFAAMPVWVDP